MSAPYYFSITSCPITPLLLHANGTDEACRANFLTTVDYGDVLRVRLASGGGHGDPLLRDAVAVPDDVLEEKMSTRHARSAYGVAIAGNPLAVDEAETSKLRGR